MGAARELAAKKPDYMSITYGAGGGNTSNSVATASFVQNDLGVTALAHLTCVGAGKENIRAILSDFKDRNVHNILALRGDFPSDDFDKESMVYKHASQLVRDIKDFGGFSVGGACYPEGHIENPDKEKDFQNLLHKIDSGVDFLVTQLFFDNSMVYRMLDKLAAKNVTVPVTVGIMPVTNTSTIKRMCSLSGATLTPKFKAMAEKYSDNQDALKQAGIAYATEQIIDLLVNGIRGIHIYTMNKPEIANKIMDNISSITEEK